MCFAVLAWFLSFYLFLILFIHLWIYFPFLKLLMFCYWLLLSRIICQSNFSASSLECFLFVFSLFSCEILLNHLSFLFLLDFRFNSGLKLFRFSWRMHFSFSCNISFISSCLLCCIVSSFYPFFYLFNLHSYSRPLACSRIYIQQNFCGLNTDGSFTSAASNSFLSQ